MVASALPSVGAGFESPRPAMPAENLPGGLPANQEAAVFAQALQAQHTPEVAALPVASPGLSSHLSAGLQDVSSKLAAWHVPGSAEPAAIGLQDPPGSSPVQNSLTSAMAEAVTGLQGAYVFAIEATLVSRGSTEGTKILNTLLKGQ